jgi:hypothetical protein
VNDEKLDELIEAKFSEELKKFDRPHKFFITENGRHVCDGGDLYNQVFEDVLKVTKEAVKDILKETLK